MKLSRRLLHPILAWRPSLRTRFTLWVTALLLVSGAVLGVVINLTANYVFPKVVTSTIVPLGSDKPRELLEVPPAPLGPGESPPPVTVIASSSGDVVEQRGLGKFRLISSLVLAGVVVVGSVGAYVLSGRLLRPVTSLSSTALAVHGGNLAVRASLEGPEDEVKTLGRSFNTMLDRLQEAFERERQFVSAAAHELRTPLAVLRANLDVVTSEMATPVGNNRNGLASLDRGLSRLQGMVSNLLFLAADRPLDMDEVPLTALLEEVVSELQVLARDRQVELQLEGDPEISVRCDADLLTHAFGNLVQNGILYNVAGGRVGVHVGTESPWVVVEVADTGIGIPEEDLARVFDRFYRGRRADGHHRAGSGLGLSIASHIVQRHGGTIGLRSQVGAGTTFTIHLPAA